MKIAAALLPSFVASFVAGSLVLGSAACTTTPPPAPPRDDTAVPPVTPVPATATATSTATPPTTASASASAPSASTTAAADSGMPAAKSSACKTDADCRTFASYCSESPCACRVLTTSDPDPTCVGAGPKVQCFVNPCMKKVAHCESNVCVLVTQPGGAAPKSTK